MSDDHDPPPMPPGTTPSGPPEDDMLGSPPLPRAGDDMHAPPDMPLALLAFHSPTTALVNLPPMASARHIVWLVGGLMAFSVVGMTVFPLSRVVTTQGRIVSREPALVVQSLDTAIIRSIDVQPGDVVHRGDVLAHLDPTQAGADTDNLKTQCDQYQAEVNRLEAEAQGRIYAADPANTQSLPQVQAFIRRVAEDRARLSEYDNKIASLRSELQGYGASAAMYAARVRVMSDVLGMRQKLQREQVGSRLSTLAARNDLMEVERTQVASRQQAAATQGKLEAETQSRESYLQNHKAEIYRDLVLAEHRLSEAQGEYSKARLHHDMVLLHAAEDAVVLNIGKVSPGAVVTPAQTIMTLVPLGKGLEIETVMSGRDAGFVRLGDKALIKFISFPYQQYGGAEATVRTISADSFVPGGAGGPTADMTPDNVGTAYYRVRLGITRYTLRGVPSFFQPQPGMPVTADIHVGERTIMQYLLNTVVPLVGTGMREP